MRIIYWLISIVILISCLVLAFLEPGSILFRWYAPILLSCGIVLFCIGRGPSSLDRLLGAFILAILCNGFFAVFSFVTKKDVYMDIAIAWALQTFISTLVIAKYVEGKHIDD